MDYRRAIDRLISRQLRDWDLAGRNYAALAEASTRRLRLGESTIVLQCNPARRRSSAASVDKHSLASRQCFLCCENQPAKQKAVLWGDRYKIQVNPYPIFTRHLTIADLQHVPQRLADRVGDMLQLARVLPDFVVFYNGPQCGASAPDHAHFQAGTKAEMPLCRELAHATTHMLVDGDEGFIGYVDTMGRIFFTIETSTQRAAERYVLRLLNQLPVPVRAQVPMVNVLCWWDDTDSVWRVVVFPRGKHRPACYGEGEGRLLVSPASTEMGGLWAISELKDYESLTAGQLQALYDELCLSRDALSPLIRRYRQRWEGMTAIL